MAIRPSPRAWLRTCLVPYSTFRLARPALSLSYLVFQDVRTSSVVSFTNWPTVPSGPFLHFQPFLLDDHREFLDPQGHGRPMERKNSSSAESLPVQYLQGRKVLFIPDPLQTGRSAECCGGTHTSSMPGRLRQDRRWGRHKFRLVHAQSGVRPNLSAACTQKVIMGEYLPT